MDVVAVESAGTKINERENSLAPSIDLVIFQALDGHISAPGSCGTLLFDGYIFNTS